MPTLTATTLSRNFSTYLNQVRYQGASFDVQRGTEIVARLVPPAPSKGYPVDKLSALLASLPSLDDEELAVFGQDITQAKSQLAPADDPWVF